jgi:hypothetical protein
VENSKSALQLSRQGSLKGITEPKEVSDAVQHQIDAVGGAGLSRVAMRGAIKEREKN